MAGLAGAMGGWQEPRGAGRSRVVPEGHTCGRRPPPKAPPALPAWVPGPRSGNTRGSWGWAVTLEGQDAALQSRVGSALPLPPPGPLGAAGQVLPGPLGPLPGPRRGPTAGAARPPTARGPPRPLPSIGSLLGTRRQEIPRAGWHFGHPGTVLPSRVSPACGGDVGDTAAPPAKTPKPRVGCGFSHLCG